MKNGQYYRNSECFKSIIFMMVQVGIGKMYGDRTGNREAVQLHDYSVRQVQGEIEIKLAAALLQPPGFPLGIALRVDPGGNFKLPRRPGRNKTPRLLASSGNREVQPAPGSGDRSPGRSDRHTDRGLRSPLRSFYPCCDHCDADLEIPVPGNVAQRQLNVLGHVVSGVRIDRDWKG